MPAFDHAVLCKLPCRQGGVRGAAAARGQDSGGDREAGDVGGADIGSI
jgi:hypothetical protein